MPVKKADFEKFIDEAIKEFGEFEKEVDVGLKKIETHINTVVTDTVAYLSGDFKTQLTDLASTYIKSDVLYMHRKTAALGKKATTALSELCRRIDDDTNTLAISLNASKAKRTNELEEKLKKMGIDSSLLSFFDTFRRIARNMMPPNYRFGPDLRDRKNWDPIIEKLEHEGYISG